MDFTNICRFVIVSTFFVTSISLFAAPSPNAVETHIIDVGAGLCTITAIPEKGPISSNKLDDHLFVFVYDTGSSSACRDAIGSKLSQDIKEIDLLIVSHSDWDHYGGFEYIASKYNIKTVWC